jgi:AcrR family transcriptional regulator
MTEAAVETEPGSDARAQVRRRIVEAATDLLARGGPEAVTTRAVAGAARVQPPAIYRLFGDKEGLLDAVAEHGYARFLAAKGGAAAPADPVEDLRFGWDLAVEFALENRELYALMYGEPRRSSVTAAYETGMDMLRGRIRRLAAAGRLRVEEHLAFGIIHATARGAVLTWLSLPEDQRHPGLLGAMREAMVAAVTTQTPAVEAPGPAAAALALRASLSEQDVLSGAERHLLEEWLERLAGR